MQPTPCFGMVRYAKCSAVLSAELLKITFVLGNAYPYRSRKRLI